jgi:hypothetical protein
VGSLIARPPVKWADSELRAAPPRRPEMKTCPSARARGESSFHHQGRSLNPRKLAEPSNGHLSWIRGSDEFDLVA